MKKLFKIETSGAVEAEERRTPPSYAELRAYIGCQTVERVSVLYGGMQATLYVDEDGLAKELEFNHKASRVYANHVLSCEGRSTYDNLSKDAPRGMVLFNMRPLVIVGRAVLWCGCG